MKARTNDEVKGKFQKLRKLTKDPTLEGKNENEIGRVEPKPEHALKK